MSHVTDIRTHLETGSPITPIDALRLYGCFRLGARIYDLRQEGLAIETEIIERDGKRFASYRLAKQLHGSTH